MVVHIFLEYVVTTYHNSLSVNSSYTSEKNTHYMKKYLIWDRSLEWRHHPGIRTFWHGPKTMLGSIWYTIYHRNNVPLVLRICGPLHWDLGGAATGFLMPCLPSLVVLVPLFTTWIKVTLTHSCQYQVIECHFFRVIKRHQRLGGENSSTSRDQDMLPQVESFTGPIWGPPGADRTQVGPMLATCNLLSGSVTHSFYG